MPVLNHGRLTRRLREGAKGGTFLLFGEEDHLKETAAREIVAAHLDPATRDFNLDEVRGPDVGPDTLASLIATPPMMAEWRVVVVRDTQALAANATARSLLEGTAQQTPPGLALVLLADPAGSQAKFWTTLKAAATAVEFPRLSDADLPGWLLAWAAAEGLAMDEDAARAVGAAIGSNLAAAVREMEKLRDYVGARAAITRQDVEAAVGSIPRENRWEWMDAVGERRLDVARARLPVLLDLGESGVGLIIGLTPVFLRIALCKAGGRAALERALPQNQKWLARRAESQARRWEAEEVDPVLDHLRRADRLLKSAPLTDLQVMDELLLRLEHERAVAA